MGKKKNKKGGRNQDDDWSDGGDVVDITKPAPDPSAQAAVEQPQAAIGGGGGKKGKKGKKPPRGAVRVQNDDDSDEDMMAKLERLRLEELKNEDSSAKSSPAPVKKGKGKKGKKGKQQIDSEPEVSEEESEGSPSPVPEPVKKGKKGKKKGKKLDSDEEVDELRREIEETEAHTQKTPALQKKKGKKGKPAPVVVESEDSDNDSEEESEVEVKSSKPKRNAFESLMQTTSEEESEPEVVETKKKKKKKKSAEEEKPKKSKKSKKSKADADDDSGEVKKKKKKKKKVKESKSESEPEHDSEEASPEPEEKPKPKKDKKRAKKPSMLDAILAGGPTGKIQLGEGDAASGSSTPKTVTIPLNEEEEGGQQFCHDDMPVADQGGFKELDDEELAKKSKKDRRKYVKELEKWREMKEAEQHAEVAIGTSSLANFSVSQRRDDTSKATQQDLSDDIKIDDFSIGAKGNPLYDNAELRIIHGRKYGLIGPNGKGKTTLLRCIAARVLKIPAHIDLLYCEQEIVPDATPAIQAVLNADKKRLKLIAEAQRLTEALQTATTSDLDEINEALKRVNDDMKAHGVDQAEPKARRILAGLGFTIGMQKKATQDFSGGWRMRVSLARALFLEPTLLMLDEPTNHLDLNAVIWLNNYLMGWKKTLLIVSHDQQFLDDVCTDIIHLDDRKLKYYRGNYTQWKAQYQIYLEERMKQFIKQEKRLKELKKTTTKKKAEEKTKELLTRKQKKNANQKKNQDMMQESTADTVELISKPREYCVDFTFPNPPQLNPPVLGLYDVTFGYPGQPNLFENVDFGVDMDSRISIVGPNGVGKSTLLKLLLGEIQPVQGEVRRNHRLRTAYYSQHSAEYLPLDKSPVDYLRGKFDSDCDYQKARKYLGNTGLDGKAHTIPIKDLSGGQKARVALADLILSAPDIIVLDEPTNNLDIESIDALANAINDYDGGVVIVSHDARLITHTDCQLWVCGEMTCADSKGTFEDYKDRIMEELEEMLDKNS